MKAKTMDSCKGLFKRLGILTLYSQYIYSTLMFAVKHKDIFKVNTEVQGINIHQKLDLHIPSTRLTRIQRGFILFRHHTAP
jgi:hypothetical protein